LGSFVVAKTWQAATARAGQPEHTRRDAALYVDECHNFLTLPRSFDDMLAEAPRLPPLLVLATSTSPNSPKDLRDAVATNARNKIWLAISPDDARTLERHVTPQLSAHDLANLDARKRVEVTRRNSELPVAQWAPALIDTLLPEVRLHNLLTSSRRCLPTFIQPRQRRRFRPLLRPTFATRSPTSTSLPCFYMASLMCGHPARSGSPFIKGSRTPGSWLFLGSPHVGHAGTRALQR
jgi:hypothetical protein